MARFKYKNLEQLKADVAGWGLELPFDPDFSVLGEGLQIGPLSTPNRFVAQPMEGFDADADGTPGELSFRRYRRFAAGGSGLIWLEATAVTPEGRSNPAQFYLHEGNVDVFRRLVDEVRQTARERCGHEVVVAVQMTHSGRYSKPDGAPKPILAHHNPEFDAQFNVPADYPIATDDYLEGLMDRFVDGARLAARAGFDAVDMKGCHGYLVSGLLAARQRPGKFGGSYENRTRFIREAAGRIAREVDGVRVYSRINCYDGIAYPYGWGADADNNPDLAEPLRLVRELVAEGVELINVTIGNPRFKPQYNRPFERSLVGLPIPEEHPLVGIARFNAIACSVQEAVGEVPVVGGALAWLRHYMPYVAAGLVHTGGLKLIGQGRGMFAYPDSPNDILQTGRMDPDKCCTTCSMCSQLMKDHGHAGCVIRDKEIYGKELKRVRQSAREGGKKL